MKTMLIDGISYEEALREAKFYQKLLNKRGYTPSQWDYEQWKYYHGIVMKYREEKMKKLVEQNKSKGGMD